MVLKTGVGALRLLVTLAALLAFTTACDRSSPLGFAQPVDLANSTIAGVSALDAADINGDGLPDVFVADGGKYAAGGVTFAWLQSPAVPGSQAWTRHELPKPASLTASDPTDFIGAAQLSDMDGDGDNDLIVSMDHHSGDNGVAFVYLLENPGGALATQANRWTIHTVARLSSTYHINDMVVADFDGDAKPDVLVRALNSNQLLFFFQNSINNWTFRSIGSGSISGTLTNGEGLAVGQIDGFYGIDVALGGYWLQAPANPRTGNFTVRQIDPTYASVNANTKEALGDINLDGRIDLVISPAEGYRGGGNHVLAWYESPPNPAMDPWTQHVLEVDYNGGHSVDLVDLDADGDLDLVTSVSWDLWGQNRQINVRYWNQLAGAFTEPQVVWTGNGLYSAAIVDIGADGDIDIVGPETFSNSARPMFYEAIPLTSAN